jgi:hypothetical protein
MRRASAPVTGSNKRGWVRGRSKKCLVVLGVNALARETGLPKSTVSERMRKGQSADQIRLYAAVREGRSPQRASGPLPPHTKPAKSIEAPTESEVIRRGRNLMAAIEDVKLRRVRALAVKEELEIQRLRSELIPTVYVRKWAECFLAYSRDTLMTGPSELQAALALEPDPAKCAAILRAWVERAMAKFHQTRPLVGRGRGRAFVYVIGTSSCLTNLRLKNSQPLPTSRFGPV